MKTTFISEFLNAAKDAPRLYFAPLAGAANAIKAEFSRVKKESAGQVPLASSAKQ
ncbi:hypothetical protein PVE_P0215 (plasmid) [Pseudomonas veronii 1YdBTEX2]|uniref:Uncharacterized protein n=2 Tax=Pseudomonas veronii TaxID=76761 RepID=A0A7Y1FDT8_PSEVE|nr:hypothetical protein [Pseudomonas veronii]MBI6557258.1 hypothetical protein [Pseudomonas veronii]MBI6653973.1 hypothetical protein [Pseudomonas veronii]NMY13927.1 hypothetical protein [Pseudomonas veronii]SBW85255.1 hypothetical protein PVE_P0215 [Pseudomonas veronii 1YdBTEX2]